MYVAGMYLAVIGSTKVGVASGYQHFLRLTQYGVSCTETSSYMLQTLSNRTSLQAYGKHYLQQQFYVSFPTSYRIIDVP